MRINLASVLVDDQQKALRFYTEVLGFVKKTDVPLGEHSWLTVVSPEEPDGVELVLEPGDHPAVGPFKAALVADGIPFTSFAVADVQKEYADRAMKLLHEAVKAGFKDAGHLRQDTDLASLQGREDFKDLLADLEKKKPQSAPPP